MEIEVCLGILVLVGLVKFWVGDIDVVFNLLYLFFVRNKWKNK